MFLTRLLSNFFLIYWAYGIFFLHFAQTFPLYLFRRSPADTKLSMDSALNPNGLLPLDLSRLSPAAPTKSSSTATPASFKSDIDSINDSIYAEDNPSIDASFSMDPSYDPAFVENASYTSTAQSAAPAYSSRRLTSSSGGCKPVLPTVLVSSYPRKYQSCIKGQQFCADKCVFYTCEDGKFSSSQSVPEGTVCRAGPGNKITIGSPNA